MRFLFFVLTFLPIISSAQTEVEMKGRMVNVKTEEDVNAFLDKNKDVVGQVMTFDSTDAVFEYLDAFEAGEVMTLEPDKYPTQIYLFKILNKQKIQTFKIQYIYLNGAKLRMTQIDSLQKQIIKKYKAGEPFDMLAREYSMDGNAANGGLLAWSEGEMLKEFERGVKEHLNDEVFTLDVPDQQWFYVVKNLEKPKAGKIITVLHIELKK